MTGRPTPRVLWPRFLPAMVLVVAGACEPAVEEPPSHTVVDSAGVRVVTNHDPEPDTTGWTVDPEPLLRVGDDPTDPATLFSTIRGGRLLPDGGLAVLDAPVNELRYFDSGGALLASAGGEGEGPGEFRFPVTLTARSDTLVVFDRALLRISLFSFGGEFISSRSASVAPLGQVMDVGGWTLALGDGTMVAEQFTPGRRPEPETVDRIPLRLVMGREATGTLDTLGVYGWRALFTLPQVRRDAFLPNYETVYTPGRDDRGLVVGDTESGVIDRYGPGGMHRVRAIHPQAGAAPPDGAVERERAVALDWAIAQAESRPRFDLERYRRWLDALPQAKRWPAFRRLLVDDTGHVWALPYRPGEARGNPVTGDQEVVVFHPDGRVLGAVTLPGELEPLDVGADRILSRTVDELGVQRVVVHRLNR